MKKEKMNEIPNNKFINKKNKDDDKLKNKL